MNTHSRESAGYFSGFVAGVTAGHLYRSRLDGGEPLLAPPEGCAWKTLWSSEDRRYGGEGTASAETIDGCCMTGGAALVLAPELRPPRDEAADKRASARAKDRTRRERTRLTE